MNDNEKFKIPEEALKKIRTQAEFESFIQELYKQGVEALLKAEIDDHLGYPKHSPEGKNTGNSRNGYSGKTLKTNIGDIPLDVPRDRNGTFEPVAVPKYQRMSAKIENAIITMYSRGMTTRDIEATIKDIYGIEVSEGSISNITSSVLEDIKEWQQRPLESVYFVVWMDGIVFKVRQNGKVQGKTIYLMIGLKQDGKKQVLGMWINETESASFWLSVLTDIKARGVRDILIASTDNLTGIRQAIRSAFPNTITQLCVVHQIRNSVKYVVWKDRKRFLADLKLVYNAINRDMAYQALEEFAAKWNAKYAYAVKSWKDNWDELTAYFDYPIEIRRIIYTTNVIESLNSTIRKYTKTKTVFPEDQAALKAVYLAVANVERKWTMAIKEWGSVINQLVIIFGERCGVL
ncbi:MAG TPA: IS256 family transposase [Prolixibacteraceae bacterium]|jgi:transposase-like protein|nr:IS256 family transposase [Prolixibacteraceae bacterium]HQJ86828.1 IS256 family transposase [Prolixibacteraceae bacterium]